MDNDKQKEKLREEIKTWKKRYETEKIEHEFYQNSAMESKRKNKLLKVAVGRLQHEYDELLKKHKVTDEELAFVKHLHAQVEKAQQDSGHGEVEEDDAGTFMTRISEDGQAANQKIAGHERVNSRLSQDSVALPDLQIKKPSRKTPNGSSSQMQYRAHATNESFLSGNVLKSVASSRNKN